MSAPLNVLAVLDRDASAAADLRYADRALSADEYCQLLVESVTARAVVAELIEAAHAAKRAFLMGQPEVRGTDTVYPLDGALVGNALDSLRAALAACGVKS